MIATLPRHHHREAPDLLTGGLAIALLLSPFLLKLHLDLHHNRAVATEFQQSRNSVLSRIRTASARNDLDTLNHIRDRYAALVPDPDFQMSLQHAIARAASRHAEVELAISRQLDLTRHQEESLGTQPTAAKEAR